MKYIDADKLINEIQQLQKTNKSGVPHISEFIQGGIYGFDIATEKIIRIISSLQQEQSEVQNGKFVFPKYLYARTKDNKTIDMSYAPQDMTAVEYIRNDFVEQEQSDVDFEKEIKTLSQSREWEQMKKRGSYMKEALYIVAHHFYKLGLKARKEE